MTQELLYSLTSRSTPVLSTTNSRHELNHGGGLSHVYQQTSFARASALPRHPDNPHLAQLTSI
jgi:hypothetical protein